MTDILSFIFIGLLAFYFIFIRNIRTGLTKLGYYKTQSQNDEFISIIIAFRNERDNILANLKSLETQNYPLEKYEVIYINDFSTDNSTDILNENKVNENIAVHSVLPKIYSDGHDLDS